MATSDSQSSEFLNDDMVDHLDRVAAILYAVFAFSFAGGVFLDWQSPGTVVVAPLTIFSNPSNSGLFLLGIILLFLGYALSKAADKIEEMNMDHEDETQEWVVNIKGLDTDPGAGRRERREEEAKSSN
ncbi:MAG: hypothetical protein ABEJ61_03625 [Haloferacaceae archaeon]